MTVFGRWLWSQRHLGEVNLPQKTKKLFVKGQLSAAKAILSEEKIDDVNKAIAKSNEIRTAVRRAADIQLSRQLQWPQ